MGSAITISREREGEEKKPSIDSFFSCMLMFLCCCEEG